MRSRWWCLALAVLCWSCASRGAQVRVTRTTPSGQCEERGRVQGRGTSELMARNDLRASARLAAADTVVIDTPTLSGVAGRMELSGRALRCKKPTATVSAEGPTSQPAAAEVPTAAPAQPAATGANAEAAADLADSESAAESAPPGAVPAPEAAEAADAADAANKASGDTAAPDAGSASAAPAATPSVTERLRELKALHDEGLITADEYEQRRKELLQEL
jgi:hypothetical protein